MNSPAAPEVLEYSNLPERRRAGDAEGLQTALQQDWNQKESHAVIAVTDGGSQPSQQVGRRSRWKNVIVCGICALVALGAGIGIGFKVGKDSSNPKAVPAKSR
jgi:hypothetical protein